MTDLNLDPQKVIENEKRTFSYITEQWLTFKSHVLVSKSLAGFEMGMRTVPNQLTINGLSFGLVGHHIAVRINGSGNSFSSVSSRRA